VVKGTTKYMAPEVVSDQFGAVGPHSDLYSLGFSAYELMCGEKFESLFPGLNMFGRDRQIAWMMWHSAPDRRLPKIGEVFENVPEELAHVIEKLCEKDPAKRYRRAEEVIDALSEETSGTKKPISEETAESEKQAKQARRKRVLSIAALSVSVLLSAVLALWPAPLPPSPKPQGPAEEEREGAFVSINHENHRVILMAPGGSPEVVKYDPDRDDVLLNSAELIDFDDLEEEDWVVVECHRNADGSVRRQFNVTRALPIDVSGLLAEVQPASRIVVVAPHDSPNEPLQIFVPDNVEILLNGEPTLDVGTQVTIAHLRPDDGIDVRYKPAKSRQDDPVAVSVEAKRVVDTKGIIESVTESAVTLRLDQPPKSRTRTLTLAQDCRVLLNGADKGEDGQPYTLADLKEEDEVVATHDDRVTKINILRALTLHGAVAKIDVQERQIVVSLEGRAPLTLSVPEDCEIKLEGSDTTVDLSSLRPRDGAAVTADMAAAQVRTILVRPQADSRIWALVIAHQQYNDRRLTELKTSERDAELLRDTLIRDYRVPADQLHVELDAPRRTLQEIVPEFLGKVPAGCQLIVYFVGHAYRNEDGVPYLAPDDFDLGRQESTGLKLRWLLDELHKTKAADKILLFDAYHDGLGQDRNSKASSADMVRSLESSRDLDSNAVRIIASCDGQSDLVAQDTTHGLFAACTAEALKGPADLNRDYWVTPQELYDFVKHRMSEIASTLPQTQTPVLLDWAPPPPLSSEAKEALLELLDLLRRRNPMDDAFAMAYLEAESLAPKQPYAFLMKGLALMKDGKQLGTCWETLEEVYRNHPDSVIVNHALAWREFREQGREHHLDGLKHLRTAVANLHDSTDPYAEHLFEFAGQMSAFSVFATETIHTADLPKRLTEQITQHGEGAKEKFMSGYRRMEKGVKAQDVEFHKKNVASYSFTGFDFEIVMARLADELDD
jgi:hypothetical protein